MLKNFLIIIIVFVIAKNNTNDSAFGNFNLNQTEHFTSFEYLKQSTNQLFNNSTRVRLKRVKRGVFQLSGIIKCTTGCKPLSYNRYGCFCGKSNYPGQPVDSIDKCCQEHDACYSKTSCAQIMIYILPYQWKCVDYGEAKCISSLTETKTVHDKCSYQLCECDRILGDCLKQYDCPANKRSCSEELPIDILEED